MQLKYKTKVCITINQETKVYYRIYVKNKIVYK